VKKLKYGIGTALSIVRTAVVFTMLWVTNRIANALGESGIW